MSEYRMTFPRMAQTDFPVGDLLARIRELEAELASIRAPDRPSPAPVSKPRKSTRRASDDFRTAAELWQAGEATEILPKSAYRSGPAKTVRVTFADGEALRLSTYLDGPQGIAAAARTARAIRQAVHRPDWERTGTWRRDARGTWRLIDGQPCPAILVAEFVDAE